MIRLSVTYLDIKTIRSTFDMHNTTVYMICLETKYQKTKQWTKRQKKEKKTERPNMMFENC